MLSRNLPNHNIVINKERLRHLVVIGTPREGSDAREGMVGTKPKPHIHFLSTVSENNRQLGPKRLDGELRGCLGEIVGSKGLRVVVSDIGEKPRRYPFERAALASKQADPDSKFVLLTSVNQCTGIHTSLENFVAARKFADPSVLQHVDYVFPFDAGGNSFRLMANLVEDHANFTSDMEKVILVVEDSPRDYGKLFNGLYMQNEGRARILLARSLEEAESLAKACSDKLIGVIADVLFPSKGAMPKGAENAWSLFNLVRAFDPRVPIVFQSEDASIVAEVTSDGRVFGLHKESPSFYGRLQQIINDYFGFGDFVFRTPAGIELARAQDLFTLCALVKNREKIIDESLLYHASNDHFSNWLWLHGYKDLAKEIKKISTTEAALLRSLLLEMMQPLLAENTAGSPS